MTSSRLFRLSLGVAAAALLSACATTDRLREVGRAPELSEIDNSAALYGRPTPQTGDQAQAEHDQLRQLAQLRGIAQAHQAAAGANSLWVNNARSFFDSPRASRVGDIMTVNIDIADRAQVSNTTARSRTGSNESQLNNFFGGGAALDRFFHDSYDPASASGFGSSTSLNGTGSVNRTETIQLTLAAIVVEVLWNGNMVIHGRQEVRVNNEVRELLISGIVRPQDIAADNTIAHTQIAEARVSYGGRGHISDMQRPTIGQEVYDILWPF
ncbi:flagellar basal body L-ring protein FlgH [Woodsholea maritima]|uniref:flagellar basal body L-ring protein FlgH n=1 Tax=Woodsholea maritima TaxID=240237 RepID=UPI0003779C06|nr:flagellar basal body L-ring protein FlgH [Woodsholea maritima]